MSREGGIRLSNKPPERSSTAPRSGATPPQPLRFAASLTGLGFFLGAATVV